MKITKKDVEKFRSLYQKNFGEDLTDEQSKKQLGLLVRIMDIATQEVYEEQIVELLHRDTNLSMEVIKGIRKVTR